MRRVLLIVGGLGVLVGLAGFFLLRTLLTSERLHELVLDVVSRTTGLDVTVDEAKLSVLPFGISLTNVVVAGPTPDAPPTLVLESGLVRLRVAPILRRALVVDRVELRRPRVAFVQLDGETVLPGRLADAAGTPTGGERAPAAPNTFGFEGKIRAYSIADGEFRLLARDTGEEISVEGIDLTGRVDARADGTILATGELLLGELAHPALAAHRATLRDLEPSIVFEVEYHPGEGRLAVSELALAADWLVVKLEGEVRGLPESPELELTLGRQSIELARLRPWVESSWKSPNAPPEIGGTLTLSGAVSGPLGQPDEPLVPAIDLELREGRVVPAESPLALERLSGAVHVRDGVATLEDVRGAIGRSRFTVTGRVEDPFGEPRAILEGHCPLLDLSELAAAEAAPTSIGEGASTSGSPDERPPLLPPLPEFDVDLSLRADSLVTPTATMSGATLVATIRDSKAHVETRIEGADFDGVLLERAEGDLEIEGQTARGEFRAPLMLAHVAPIENVTGRIDLGEDRILKIDDVRGGLWDGSLEGSARLDLNDPGAPEFFIRADANAVDANALVSAVSPARDILHGKIDVSSEFRGAGATPEQVVESLAGNGTFEARQGRLEKSPAIASMWSALNLREEREIPFQDLVTAFEIVDGKLVTRDVELRGPNANWKASGSVSFEGLLDYDVQVELDEALSQRYRKRMGGDLAKILADTDGKLVIDLKIKGPAANPEVAADLNALAKRAAKNLEDRLKKDGKKLLENLFGG